MYKTGNISYIIQFDGLNEGKQMGDNTLKEKNIEELEKLVKIAEEQGNSINLNLVYMMIDSEKIDFAEAMKYFEQNNEIEFDTSFQRKAGLWSKRQKSQLLESIFLRIPLPAFYFDATEEDEWLIIDGLQRVSALKEFIVDKSLKLKELEFFPELNGCNYDKLPRMFQRRIDETVINVYLVNPSTPENVKFNIFKRINTGGLTLEPQEIRNALFQGQATEFLQECSKLECFINATAGSIKVRECWTGSLFLGMFHFVIWIYNYIMEI